MNLNVNLSYSKRHIRLMETSMSNPVYLSIFIAWRIIIKTKLSITLSFYTFNSYINKITYNIVIFG